MSPIVVLASVGIATVSAAVILAVLIIGIRRGDRRHLASGPESNLDAFARHLLLSVRYPASQHDSVNNETGANE